MSRTLSTKNLYDIKHDKYLLSGIWGEVLEHPTKNGAWIIWGAEKNGKTWCALLLADYLSEFAKVLYVSAEEGTDDDFVEACKRARISPSKKGLNFTEYESIDEIRERLKRNKSARIVFIDNLTIYADEFKKSDFKKLLDDFPRVLFIFLAHEERNQPYTAIAKYVRKMAKRIIHVKGLACTVSGRCKGGVLYINEEKAALYHGQLQSAS